MSEPNAASLSLHNIAAMVDGQETLRSADLHLQPGELFAVIGPHGSGKSSLVHAISGLIPLSRGTVKIDDKNVTRKAAHRRRIATMLQSCALWPHLNIADNIALALRGSGLRSRQRNERIQTELAFVGLQEFAQHMPHQLSPSQRKRVALVRTLAADARLCLLDDPFSALEAQLRSSLPWLLRKRQKQSATTTLVTSQDPLEVLAIADRAAMLYDGELLQTGTPAELYDQPANRRVASIFPYVNLFYGEIELDGEQAIFRGETGIVFPLLDQATRRPRTGTAMFHPSDLYIVTDIRSPAGNELRMTGRVEDIEFCGAQLRYRIDLFGKPTWMETQREGTTPRAAVGDTLVLGIDPTRIRILEP